MIVRELKAGEERAWDSYVRRHADPPGSLSPASPPKPRSPLIGGGFGLYLSSGWTGVLEKTYGHETRYLMAEERGELKGVLPLLVVRSRPFATYVTSLPGGLCTLDLRAVVALLERAVDLTVTADAQYLVLRDGRRVWQEGLITDERYCSPILPLPDHAQRLWASLPSRVRNRVRKAQRAGLSVSLGGQEQIDLFYRVFSRNMRDLGTPVFDKRLLHNAMTVFRDQTRILIVQRQGRPIGGMFLFSFEGRVHNPWVSSIRDFFACCPNDLLYWEALRWACESGHRSFDFGRSRWGSGPFRFKTKWGAMPQPLYYQYYLRAGEVIPDPAARMEEDVRYRLVRWTWRRLPVAVTRVTGPRIARYANPLG